MISPSAAGRVCGVDVEYKNFNVGNAAMLPQRLAVFGVGNDDADYGTAKMEVGGSSAQVGDRFGYGSPLHLVSKILFPLAGNSATFPVTIYPLEKAKGALPATAIISITGNAKANGSGKVYIGGIKSEFAVKKGDAPDVVLDSVISAINGNLDNPARAEKEADKIKLTSKWSGETSNMISLEAECDVDGVVVVLTDFGGGAIDPDITPAL